MIASVHKLVFSLELFILVALLILVVESRGLS